MIYLDYAANTPVDEEVLAAFCEAARGCIANPNSPHGPGVQARAALDSLTARILNLLGTPDRELVYTGGASEANNLAIKGAAHRYRARGKHLITTMLEHSSVSGAFAALQNEGFEVDDAPLGAGGLVDLDGLKELLRPDTILVSVCAVDSEAGTRQPIHKIGELLKGYPGCFLHVDATQSVGKLPESFACADLFTFAPHKFYGLNGCGALVKRGEVQLEPLIHGGISTTPYRSGTPALALAASMEKALSLACDALEPRLAHVRGLNRKLRRALASFPAVRVNSPQEASPFILNFSLPGVKIGDFLLALEERGVILSSKSACCAPGTISRPVYALTKDRKRALSTLRISLSHLTGEADIDGFLAAFSQCLKAL